MSYHIRLKRVYEKTAQADGQRVLADRLWPRGKKREALALDDWCKAPTPSASLRKRWHGGDLDYQDFEHLYRRELQDSPDALVPLMRLARKGTLTLLTASRDIENSHLPILRQALLGALDREDREADGREPNSPVCYQGD